MIPFHKKEREVVTIKSSTIVTQIRQGTLFNATALFSLQLSTASPLDFGN